MNKKVLLVLTLVLALAPVVLLAVMYPALPQQAPMHWSVGGEVTYGDKSSLWMMALLSPLLFFLLRGLPKIDPRKKNYAKFQTYYDGFCLAMMLFLLCMNALMLSESFWPGRLSVSKVVILGVGVLLLFLGNLMPKIKNNFFMGIRTPWTLSDPDVWNRANRLGGQCFFGFGLVMMAGGLLLPDTVNMVLVIVGAAVTSVVPMVMSYIWYRKKLKSNVDKGNGP